MGQNFSNLPKFLDRFGFSKKLLETFMGIYNDFLISAKILDSRFFTRFRAFSKKAILPFSEFVKLLRHIFQELIRCTILRPFWKSNQIPLFLSFTTFWSEERKGSIQNHATSHFFSKYPKKVSS